MTNPDETSPSTPLDPSDPRWVEDILARARRRAEESQTTKPPTTAVATPDPPSTPNAPAPRTSNLASPPASQQSSERPDHGEPPRRDPRPVPRSEQPTESGPAASGSNDSPMPRAAQSRMRRGSTAVEERVGVEVTPAGSADDPGSANVTAGANTDEDDRPKVDRTVRNWLEWGGVIVGALLVAFLIRAVFFQAFYIPSESMESTLDVGDRILVNKLSYKFHDVNRGDLVVFEKPAGETSALDDLIKRVIALPGETIEQRGSDLFIDRGEGPQQLTESYVNEPNNIGPAISWVQGCANPATETDRCTIPEGHVWVMGDNRGHSRDSRFFGPVDEDLIVGRAFVKVWPFTKIGFL